MDNIYQTTDVYLTAYLILNGEKLVEHVKQENTFSIFNFKKTQKLEIFTAGFYSGQALIEPLAFRAKFKAVRQHMEGHITLEDVNNG